MTAHIEKIADSFWNIRGTFKVLGVLDVGSQMSLAQLSTGGFVLLDSYTLGGDVKREVFERTSGGKDVEAILNLHPFHTVHVRAVAEMFPNARLYGTRRHVQRAPELRWEKTHTNDPELQEAFAEDFEFSVPRGVEFIPKNETLHFSSVLAYHRASRALHVDDTLGFAPPSLPLLGGVRFHPSLSSVLEKRAGAAQEFRAWAGELSSLCEKTEHLCPAHMKKRPPPDVEKDLARHVREALRLVDKTLVRHQKRYG